MNVLLRISTLVNLPDVTGVIEEPSGYSFGTTGGTGHIYLILAQDGMWHH